MSAEIKLSGMTEILAKLEEMGTKTANSITKEALIEAGEYEAEQMKSEAPVSDENKGMADSIKVSNIKSKNGVKYVEVSPDKEHFYFQFVELGTSEQPANPFMARTLAKTKDEVKEIIKEALKRGLAL